MRIAIPGNTGSSSQTVKACNPTSIRNLGMAMFVSNDPLGTDDNIEDFVISTNSVTGKQSEKVYVQSPGGITGMLIAFQRSASSVGIVLQIIPNSQSIRVCGRDNIFQTRGLNLTTRQF